MATRENAYSTYGLSNGPNSGPSSSFTPADVKLDPLSNSTTFIGIITSAKIKFVAEGSFTYNVIKSSLVDVTSSSMKSYSLYFDSVLQETGSYDTGVDLKKSLFGTYAERLEVYKENDEFVGSLISAQDDQVRGGAGNDRFTGYGSGQYGDYFNGEGGFDVTILRGKFADYTIKSMSIYDITKDDGTQTPGFQLTDKTANRDGIDYYNNVERLRFSDKVVALDIDGNAGQAYRLYKAALNRTPDEKGLAGWIKFMDDGGALSTMAQQFIDSQEFRTKYGILDNAGFVNQLYINVLNRNGEPAGVNGWVGGLNNGLSRADVLKGFSESGENQANVIGQIKNGIIYAEWWLV